jgi:hypothetical protein
MKPEQMEPRSFSAYPTQGRELVLAHLPALRQTPLPLLPALLRDFQEYDWKFPTEQIEIANRIAFIERRPACLAAFARIALIAKLEDLNWIDEPGRFIEELSAYLWSSHQIDDYSRIASDFVQQFRSAYPPPAPPQPRLLIVVVGRDASIPDFPLFERLRPHGCFYTHVAPHGAPQAISQILSQRIAKSAADCAHWYIDGGTPWPELSGAGLTRVDYPALAPVNRQILRYFLESIQSGSGPEVLRSRIARLTPADVEASEAAGDPRLQHFAVSLFTEGSGTQIFSTSFVQWAAREALRRAQPETLCIRFAPRQRQQAFNTMVRVSSQTPGPAEVDPQGSLVDADMSAYYAWLELQRLSGAAEAHFVAWFENQSIAFAAGPGIKAGTESSEQIPITGILSHLSSS